MEFPMVWQHWVNMVLGLAIVVVAFMGLTGVALMWTLVVGGALVAILGLWGAMSGQSSTSASHAFQ
jgi:hypothetical protein